MANTLKFTGDSYGYVDNSEHVDLVNAAWNIDSSHIVAIYDLEEGIGANHIPQSIRDKYGIAPTPDIVVPAAAIVVNDPSFEGYYYSGEILYLINTNLWINLNDTEEVLIGDIKDLGTTTDLLINAMAGKPGNGVVDLGDLNKLGYTVMYMAGDGELFWRASNTTPYVPAP